MVESMLSLLLGLFAWLLPILALTQPALLKRWLGQSWHSLTAFISMTVCALAIWCELYAQYQRLIIEDYSAMLDTFPSSVKLGLFMIIVTVILNAFLLYRARKLS